MFELKDYDKSRLPEWARKYKVIGIARDVQKATDILELKDYDKSRLPEWARKYKVIGIAGDVPNTQKTYDDFSFDDKDLTWGDAIMSHGISGASAGYSDEAQALWEAGPLNYWRGNKQAEETYNRQVARHRAYLKALAEKYPIWSNIAYGAGSLVPTALSFIPWLGILRAGSVATSAFGNLGKAALLGAGSGALHGSGAGDGLDGRLVSAGTGASIGAVAGPLGSLVGTGASRLVRSAGKGLQNAPFIRGYLNPAHKQFQTKAVREVAKTLHDDEVKNVAESLASAPRNAFLTDISPNLEVSLANMGQKNTQVSKLLQEAHDKRMRQATTRLKKSADENITPLRDTKDFKKALEEKGAREHGPLYAEAYRIPIDKKYYGDLNNLFELEVVQDALKQAAQTLKRDFRYPKLEQFRSKKFPHLTYKPTMQLLDETKKALDSLSNMYDRAGNKHLA
ncbi:hypothetical protein, partial [Bartonella queenslandensis]|uniref:glycine zipper family protein n=1 Tax=Bartonella queenslandensis TaxID=481138 RepID=UPI0005859F1B